MFDIWLFFLMTTAEPRPLRLKRPTIGAERVLPALRPKRHREVGRSGAPQRLASRSEIVGGRNDRNTQKGPPLSRDQGPSERAAALKAIRGKRIERPEGEARCRESNQRMMPAKRR